MSENWLQQSREPLFGNRHLPIWFSSIVSDLKNQCHVLIQLLLASTSIPNNIAHRRHRWLVIRNTRPDHLNRQRLATSSTDFPFLSSTFTSNIKTAKLIVKGYTSNASKTKLNTSNL